MKVYISGPMSGLPDNNFPAFDAAAELLRAAGHTVINPADISRNLDQHRAFWGAVPANWQEYMQANLSQLFHFAEAIHFLPGWGPSYGARIEALVAEKLGLEAVP